MSERYFTIMKFLLVAVNAKFIHSNPAVYSLRAYALQEEDAAKGAVEIAEYTINHPIEEILSGIYFRKPDAIGFSCYVWNITYVLEIAREIKKLLPGTAIWLGGPEVSYDAQRLLRTYPFLAGIIIGEGEETFLALLRRYLQKRNDFTDINGLAVRVSEDSCVLTPPRGNLDLSEIPFLYEDLEPFTNRIIYYESSRGCPFRCSYCLSSIDKSVRFRDMETVKKELAFFLAHNVKQVKFVDRTFNCKKEHTLAIWHYLLEHDNGVTNFHFEIAADILDEQELALLKKFRPGAVQLEIGVQSTNEKTIHEIDRRMDVDRLSRIVARIHEGHNVHIHLDLIAGLPFEDYASFGRSFDDVYAMQPEQLQLGFLKVLKGSKMHEKAGEYGMAYRSCPPYEVLYTNWLSYEEVCRLKHVEEMVELYYNSNQFTTTLPLAVAYFSSPFGFFEALADYYEEKGYFLQSPSRSYRYQVLLSFLDEKTPAQRELFAESLTVDYYLRERSKTRPDFSPDMAPYKERVRSLFRREAQMRACLTTETGYGKLCSHNEGGSADARTLARAMHIEPVRHDFRDGKDLEQTQYLLFDYERRDPLTGAAYVTTL